MDFMDSIDSQSTEQRDTKSFGFLRWFRATFIVILLYVLSVGPACRLAQDHVISGDFVGAIYEPLDALCIEVPIMGRVYMWYIHVWKHALYSRPGLPP